MLKAVLKTKILEDFWNSPTLMTWGSLTTRSLSLIVVLPLLLTQLSTQEISLWYLFSTLIGFQLLVDVGFSPTFSRVIAYGMGGLSTFEIKDLRNSEKTPILVDANWKTIERIWSTMSVLYLLLAVIAFLLLSIIGTLVMFRPISAISDPTYGWISWGVILLTSCLNLLGNSYRSYLQGINQIALLRRWEILSSLGAIGTSIIILLAGGGLLGLVITNQGWLILNLSRNYYLCSKVEEGRFKKFTRKKIDPVIFEAVWPSAWRSGLGVFMSQGLVQISGIMYAQFGTSSSVASYLLALKLMQVISQFSQAPFYSKIPLLARLRAEGNLIKQIQVAKRGMALGYWGCATGIIGLGLFATPLLKSIGSNAEFVSPLLWGIMGLNMFAERYGSMHLQLYSTTNHIVWHIASSVSGIIYVIVSLFTFEHIGIYAFPIGFLVSNLGFYCLYSAKHSYKSFRLNFWDFEKGTSFFPLLLLILYFLFTVTIYFI